MIDLGGRGHELLALAASVVLVAVLLYGIIGLRLAHCLRRRSAPLSGAALRDHHPPAGLSLGWRWECPGCARVLNPEAGAHLPINYTICDACLARYSAARRAQRHRRNGTT